MMISTAQAPVATKPRALIVFDFDMSLVDEDCEYFLKQIAPDLLSEIKASLTALPTSWPAFADDVCRVFSERMPDFSREDFIKTLGRVPVMPRMIDTIKGAVDQHQATVMIVSDANEVFIQSMLNHHGLGPYISELHTNVSFWEEGNRLRVKPYHPETEPPHGCKLCPANMCKGRIIDSIREKDVYDLVVYVGDGIGDFCPVTRLSSRDVVCARAAGPNGKPFALLQTIEAHPQSVRARVVPWVSGEAIYEAVQDALTSITT